MATSAYSDELTRALEAGDFEAAERLAAEYGRDVLEHLRANGDAAGREAVLRRALDTLNDCLHLTRVLRAHLATQVRENSLACQYQAAASEPRRWQFEG